uniref:uncharacterized protein LOC120334838 n=1 Tax=Styela clava TaxID=7725 RepID=UPI00193A8000|nr:uncharacterized protein LOC120334838 [Styela clava]
MNNGQPANIYDPAQYQLLISYLRSMILAGQSSTIVWTGMKYKFQNNQLWLSNGRTITIETEAWTSSFPTSYPSWENIGIIVNRNPEKVLQGVYNNPPTSFLSGVICEI